MGVPVATSMRARQDDRFDRLLRDSVASDETGVEAQVPDSNEQAAIDDQIPADADGRRTGREPDDAAAEQPVEATDDAEVQASDLDDQADVTDSIRRGEADQQNKTAGKGNLSPRTSSTPAHEPLMTAAFHAQHGTQQSLAGNPGQLQQANPAAVRAAEPTIRGAATAQQANSTPPKAAHVQTGYATKSAASMQMLEQARDSVFKQILMKLSSDGGEMR
ncbi:MAG: hypothetical protein KAI24_01005, partial [Planctomycetes bacterium]|nr:hypothetical protein [Planctomycetota bacterium]